MVSVFVAIFYATVLRSAVSLVCSSRLQLVRIQVQIQETLIKQFSHHPSVKSAMSQLDSELMDITKVTTDTR